MAWEALGRGDSDLYAVVVFSSASHVPNIHYILRCVGEVLSEEPLGFPLPVRRISDAIHSGQAYREQVKKWCKDALFGIVVLDGLRPNVTYELGLLDGFGHPILLLHTHGARVASKSFYSEAYADIRDLVEISERQWKHLGEPLLDVPRQFSDLSGIHLAPAPHPMADEAGFKEVVRNELHKLKPQIVASPSFSNGLRKVREQVARALGEGRFLEALALGDALVAIDPATCPNHRARGGALMEMGRLAESLQALDEAGKVHPNCASVLGNRAATLERMGQLDAAVESARRSAAIVPRNASAKGTLAYYLRKAGRVQEALAAAEGAIDQDRTSLYGWSAKVECLLGLGRAEEALRASEEAVRLTKAQPAALLLQGFALHGAGRHPEGLALVRQAMGGVSESKLWRHAGDLLMEMREPAEARWACQEAVGLSPGNALAWVQLSRASAALGDNDGSIAALQQALGLGHAVARVRNELAVRLLNKLEFEEGLIHSKAAAEAEPQTWQAVSTYALALSFCGQSGKALRLLEGILDRTPTSADSLLEAAIICLNGGQRWKAGRFLEEAKGKPDFPQRTVEYAGLLCHLGMDPRAPAFPPDAPNRAATPAFLEEPSGLAAP